MEHNPLEVNAVCPHGYSGHLGYGKGTRSPSVSACRHFSKSFAAMRAGSIMLGITKDQNDHHLVLVQKRSNRAKSADS